MSKEIVKEHKRFEKEEDLIEYLINELNKDEKTINMVKKRIAKYGFDLVKDLSFRDTLYTRAREKVTIYCFIHKKDFKITSDKFTSLGQGCKACGYEKIKSAKTKPLEVFIEEIIPLLGEDYYFIKEELEEHYVKATTKVPFHCRKHDVFWVEPHNFLRERRCPNCKNEKISLVQTKPFDQLMIDLRKRGGNEYLYYEDEIFPVYENSSSIIPIHHVRCGRVFYQKIKYHLNGTDCTYCSMSKGEICTEEFLTKYNIKNTPQKTFDECKNIKCLPFDFYLDDYNILIEYDGELHFNIARYSISPEKNKKKFDERIRNDNIKNEFAKNNNIPLIRIKWEGSNKPEDIRKNVYDTLNRELPKYIKDFTPLNKH